MPSSLATVSPSDRLSATLDLIDILREDKETLDALTDTKAEDARLEQGVREMLVAQGLPVDEATLAQAIAQSRAPRDLPFTPLPSGVGRTIFSWYASRSRWLPPVVITACAVAMVVGSWMGVASWSRANLQNDWQAFAVHEKTLGAQVAKHGSVIAKLGNYPSLQQQAQAHLGRASNAAAGIHSQTIAMGGSVATRSLLDLQTKALTQVQGELSAIDELVAKAHTLDTLRASAVALAKRSTPTSWPQLAAAIAAEKLDFERAMDQGNATAAQGAIDRWSQMQTAQADRDILLAAAGSVGVVGNAEAARLVSAGEAALLRGDRPAWAQANEQLVGLGEQIQQTYTLRVINDPHEKSGVWRHPHGNDSDTARNFYLVVDALDAMGNPVKVHIRNEETNLPETSSRFAVRVPEAIYEKVKADKLDNGLVDDTSVGQKVNGELNPRFTIPVAGGFITSW